MIEYLPEVEEARLLHERGVKATIHKLGRVVLAPVTAVGVVNEILIATASQDPDPDLKYPMMAHYVLTNRLNGNGALDYRDDLKKLPFVARLRTNLRAHADLHGADNLWKWKKALPLIEKPVEESELVTG